MDFVGNVGSQIDFLFTNEKTKISDSEIFLLDTNIGVDNVQVSGVVGVEGNIYIGPQGVLKGLYVPTVDKQHNYLLHTDNDDILNIRYTDNQFNPVEDSCAVRIPKLYCNDIDFNGVRLKSDSGTGILNIIGNNTLSFNGVNISYNDTCGGILYTNSHIQLGGYLNYMFNIKNS